MCLWVSQCQIIKKIFPNSFNKKRCIHRALSFPMARGFFLKWHLSVYLSIICFYISIYNLKYIYYLHIYNVLFLSIIYLKSPIFGETRKERNKTTILFLYLKIEPQASPSLESMVSRLGSDSLVHTIPNFRPLNTVSASTRQKKESVRGKAVGK